MSPEIEDVNEFWRYASEMALDRLRMTLREYYPSTWDGWTQKPPDAIKALVFAGWIIDEEGVLSPNCDIKGINAPLDGNLDPLGLLTLP